MAVSQQFDAGQARSVSKNILRQGTVAKGAIDQVEKEIKSMESWWKGESSVAFSQQFQELKPSLNKLHELVNKISSQLDQVATAKEESEKAIAGQIRK